MDEGREQTRKRRSARCNVTSYDYETSINERGEPQEKYFKLRDAITRVTGIQARPVPSVDKAVTYPIHIARESVSLWANPPKPILSQRLMAMEELGQPYGYIL